MYVVDVTQVKLCVLYAYFSRIIMKTELEDRDIERIADKVVEKLRFQLKQSSKNNDDELMDVKGLAKYLKVKESWVYEKVHTKQIPFHKAGRFPRFRKKHIDKWLENPYSLSHVSISRSKKGGPYNE
jgi:excisionase family DNA binding protein